jgi:hypothetical protein
MTRPRKSRLAALAWLCAGAYWYALARLEEVWG